MSESPKDPLLRAFKATCNLLSVPFSKEFCTLGLERIEGYVHPDSMEIIAERLGLSCDIRAMGFQDFLDADVPVLFSSRENHIYVLMPNRVEREYELFDAQSDKSDLVEVEQLRSLFAGYGALLCEKTYLEERTEEICKRWQSDSWFFSVFRQLKSYLGFILIASFLINIFALCLPVFIMNIYDRVIPYSAWTTLQSFVTAIILIMTFEFIVMWVRGFLLGHFSEGINLTLSTSLFEKTIRLKLCDAPISSGVFLQTRRNFIMIKELLTSLSLSAFIDLPFSLFFLGIIAYIGGELVYVPLFGLLILIVGQYLLGPLMHDTLHQQNVRDTQQEALQINALNHLETIKSINATQFFERRFKAACHLGGSLTLHPLINSFSQTFPMTINHLCVVALVGFGARMIMLQELSVGALVACSIFCARALMAGQISGLINRLMIASKIIKDLDQFMSKETEHNEHNHHLIDPNEAEGDISFEKIVFHYSGSPKPSLEDINCTIKAGELVCLIGQTGSGKSTMAKCITDLYTPQHGFIRFDRIPVTHIEPSNLRQLVHYVSPKSGVLYGTIRENLLFSAPHTSEEELQKVIDLTGFDRLVQRHTKGLDLTIGDNASYLSEGEIQLIGIIRALLSNAKVIILDEPTANIDTITGTSLMKNIIKYIGGKKTLIVVSHKPSLFELFDRIIVLKDGRIIKDGPSKKLLKEMGK